MARGVIPRGPALRLSETAAAPGDVIALTLEGVGADGIKDSVSELERRAGGRWKLVYHLHAGSYESPGDPDPYLGKNSGAVGYGLSLDEPDVVRIPDVPVGIYRITKGLTVGDPDGPASEGPTTLRAELRVTSTS